MNFFICSLLFLFFYMMTALERVVDFIKSRHVGWGGSGGWKITGT